MELKFKSNPDMFKKEKSGKKANTIRHSLDGSDDRFVFLEELVDQIDRMGDLTEDYFITIINSDTREQFTRKIVDVSIFSGWFIISWSHEEDMEAEDGKQI